MVKRTLMLRQSRSLSPCHTQVPVLSSLNWLKGSSDSDTCGELSIFQLAGETLYYFHWKHTLVVRASGKTAQEQEGKRLKACVHWWDGKKKKKKRQGTKRNAWEGLRWHVPIFHSTVGTRSHNDSVGLRNLALLLSAHLITNGD